MAISLLTINAVDGNGTDDPAPLVGNDPWHVSGTVNVTDVDALGNPLIVQSMFYQIDSTGALKPITGFPQNGGQYDFDLYSSDVPDYRLHTLYIYAYDNAQPPNPADPAHRRIRRQRTSSLGEGFAKVEPFAVKLHPVLQEQAIGSPLIFDFSDIKLDDNASVFLRVSYQATPSSSSSQSSDFTPVKDIWSKIKRGKHICRPSKLGIYTLVLVAGPGKENKQPVTFNGVPIQVVK